MTAVQQLAGELDGQLRAAEDETDKRLEELEQRRLELLQRGKVVEFDRDAAYMVLDELLASLVAEYLDEPRVEAAAIRVDAIRVAGHPYMTIVEEAQL